MQPTDRERHLGGPDVGLDFTGARAEGSATGVHAVFTFSFSFTAIAAFGLLTSLMVRTGDGREARADAAAAAS